MNNDLKEKVQKLPLRPGVYQFLDDRGKLLYIGKATRLRQRVQSYFRSSTLLSDAKKRMVHAIADVEVTVVSTEPEALLLETTLIKKYKPPYNVVMKDDKNFQYIHITDDLYPQIETERKLPLRGRSGEYFGPYTSGRAIRHTLALLKAIFRFCTTPPTVDKEGNIVLPKRPCLEYHLERCIGPCAGDVSPEEYQTMMKQIAQFLKGDYEEIRNSLDSAMQRASLHRRYEEAARLRDQLQAIDHMMTEQKVVSSRREDADYFSLARDDKQAAVNVFTVRRGKLIKQDTFILRHVQDQSDNDVLAAFADQYYAFTNAQPREIYLSTQERRGRHKRMLDMGIENAHQRLLQQRSSVEKREERVGNGLLQIAQAIGLLGADAEIDDAYEVLQRIEIYDNSNVQGKYPVASMVVFEDGEAAKSQYRKFKIKTVEGPDDFASMREVINRRVGRLPRAKKRASIANPDNKKRSIKEPWPRPSLIVIDGGKGQLSAAKSMLDAARQDIPVISLAKREEEIFLPGQSNPILLKPQSDGFYLMQRMRDEAHRFAIGFYRSRHLKGLLD